jgi:hypothetical protein
MSRKYTYGEVAHAMEGRRGILLDFEDSMVTRKRWVWEALKLLKSQPEKAERIKDSCRLAMNRNKITKAENRTFDILNVVTGLPYEISNYFGKKLANHIRRSVMELMLLYKDIDMRAIVTRDEIGTVMPTINVMHEKGIGPEKYIANVAEVTDDGMISGRLEKSVAYGVEGWDGRGLLTPKDKTYAIDAILRSYGIGVNEIVYVTDNDPGELDAKSYVSKNGGAVIEARKLPRLKCRPLI